MKNNRKRKEWPKKLGIPEKAKIHPSPWAKARNLRRSDRRFYCTSMSPANNDEDSFSYSSCRSSHTSPRPLAVVFRPVDAIRCKSPPKRSHSSRGPGRNDTGRQAAGQDWTGEPRAAKTNKIDVPETVETLLVRRFAAQRSRVQPF